MNFKFQRPDMAEEAAKTGGKNVFLEILMFIGVFLASMSCELLPVSIAEMVVMVMNPEIMKASMLGDIALAMELMEPYMDVLMIIQLFSTSMMILATILFCKLIQKRK